MPITKISSHVIEDGAILATHVSGLTSADIAEGISNLYYTDVRARSAISVTSSGDGLLEYNPATGFIDYTGPSAAEVRAHFSAGTGVTYVDGQFSIGQPVGITDDVSFASVTATDATFDSIQITGGTGTQGTLSWNVDDETIDLIVSPDVTYQLGQETGIVVRNLSGQTLSNGAVVRVTGASGEKVTVDLATANTELGSAPTIGVVTETIVNNATGRITTAGLVRGLNTSLLTEGAAIYLGTDGAITTTAPTSPAHLVHIGWVVRAHATEGAILVHVNNGWEIEELHNVLISDLTDNELLQWNAASSVWENRTIAEAGLATSAQGALADSALQSGDNISELNNDSAYISGNQTITLTGDVSGSGTTSIAVTIADDSHNHTIANIDGLQTALDGKIDDSQVLTNVPLGAVFTDTTYSVGDGGLTEINFTSADNAKLDGIEASANNYILPFTDNSANWNTAYGWGDHGTAGYAAASSLSNYLPLSGGTMTGNIVLPGNPTTDLQAATKQYVDTLAAASLHYHEACRVESPANLPGTYDNGTAGVGATLTNNGTQLALIVDGISVNSGDRVLLYEQSDATQNGIYTVTNAGSGSTNWVLTRATDADSYGASDPDALGEGDAFFITEGNTAAGELYVMNTSGAITFGTTNITFAQVSSAQIYNAGTGIALNGVTFALDSATQTTLTNAATAYSWGDHGTAGYLTSFTETDPTVPAHVKSISVTNISNWNTAYGWGNHATAGYLTSIPTPVNGDWWNNGFVKVGADGVMEVGKYLDFHTADSGGSTDYDLRVTATTGTLSVGGTIAATGGNSTNWNTAYSWGDHSAAGYFLASNYTNVFKSGSEIAGSQDLNNYRTTGYYSQDSNADATSGSNYPLNAAGILEVITGDQGNGLQTEQRYSQYNTNVKYVRHYYNGTWTSWAKSWNSSNDGTGSGLDADLLDGLNSTSFLRSDATDSFTGSNLFFPSLTLNISNDNTAGSGAGTYFRGNSTHFVLGLTDGNTFYCNYGNGSGDFRLDGNVYVNSNYAGNVLWGNGNDGSGSGLDADLLDGQQGSYYAAASSLGNYLPLSGGTLTGDTIITSAGTGNSPMLRLNATNNTTFVHGQETLASGLTSGQHIISVFGKEGNTKNAGYIGYLYSGTLASNNNKLTLGHWGNDDLVTIDGLGNTSINGGALQISGTTVIDSSRTHFSGIKGYLTSATGNTSITASTGIKQGYPEGWTAIYADYDPYHEWGIYHDNPSNYFLITAGTTTNNIGSFSVVNHAGDTRTAYTKIRLDQNSGEIRAGGGYYVGNTQVLDTNNNLINIGTGSFDGKVDFQGDAAIEGGSGYGVFKGYTGNDNHFISVRGIVANQTGLSITGGHQTTFVEHAENNDTSGWYFKSNQTGSYAEIARITRTGGMHLQGNKVWHAGNDGSGSGLDADLLDGLQPSQLSVSSAIATDYLNSVNYATDYSNNLIYWQASGLDTNYAPTTDWYHTIRGSHGGGNSYYSNTLAIQMTGGVAGTIFTQTRQNGNLAGWNKFWHSNNDGSGSGLDADLLDGQQGSYYAPSSSLTSHTGDTTIHKNWGLFSTNGGQDFLGRGKRVAVATTSNLILNYGGDFTNVDIQSQIYSNGNTVWHAGNDGSGSGLDADLLDGQQGSYYYPKSGGAITGGVQITFSGNNYFEVNSTSTGEAMTRYNNTTSNLWYTGIRSSTQLVGNTGYHIYSAAHGQTSFGITADGYVQGARAGTFWGSSNDGSGSGLDADLLDGLNSSEFARSRGWTNWNDGTVLNNVVGMLAWKNYNNNHVIFDASASTSPTGSAVNNTNAQVAWTVAYPTLMGWNGSQTYGVRVDSARVADSAGAVAWGNVSSKPAHIMYYQGFTLNADTMDTNSTGFTYAVGAPAVGPVARFSTGGGYDLWLNAPYSGGGTNLYFRTRNGDASSLNSWYQVWNSGNDGSGSGLDADTVDGVQAASMVQLTASQTITGEKYFQSNRNTTSSNPPLQAYSSGGTGAIMSFHRAGYYAVNFGLDSDNVIRIGGWSAATNRFQMDMSGNLTMAGNVTAYSDIRLKENIKVIPDALSKVQQLRGVTFTRNDTEDKEKLHTGVIAQEVEAVLPEAVSEDNDGIKNVAYGNMVGLLIESIKEQQTQIEELTSQVNSLKELLNSNI